MSNSKKKGSKEFIALDDGERLLASADHGEQFFLLRSMHEFDFKKHLDGRKVVLNETNASKLVKQISSSSSSSRLKFRLDKNASHIHSLRPIVRSELTGEASIGAPFAGLITIAREFTTANSDGNEDDKESDDEDTTNSSFCTNAYAPVSQVRNLIVRHMPFGSLTTLDELEDRKRGKREGDKQSNTTTIATIAATKTPEATRKEEKKSNKKKKREEAETPSTIAPAVAADNNGEPEKHKKKKSKREK